MDNLEKLLSEHELEKRELVIRELSSKGAQITEPLLKLLEANPNFHIYTNAIEVLGEIASEEAIPFLLQTTAHESSMYRESAIIALGKCLKKQKSTWDNTRQEQIFNTIVSRITDTVEDVREAVVVVISQELNPTTIELLVSTFALEYEEQAYFVQDEILLALKEASINIIPIFETLLQKLTPLERIAALDILAWLDTDEANILLKEHYQKEKNIIVRQFIYARIK